jgi:hypothetical protein
MLICIRPNGIHQTGNFDSSDDKPLSIFPTPKCHNSLGESLVGAPWVYNSPHLLLISIPFHFYSFHHFFNLRWLDYHFFFSSLKSPVLLIR